MIKKYFHCDRSLFSHTSSAGTLNLFTLLFPILLENVMNRLQGTVNTAVLSNYSEISVAAVGAAVTIIDVVLLFGSMIAFGVTVVVSNTIGAERFKKAEEVSFSGLLFGLLTSVIIIPILLLLSRNLLCILNLKGEILEEAVIYFQIRMCFLLVNVLTTVILAVLKCYGYTGYIFIVGLLSNVLNLVLNIYVIYFPQFSPVTGVAGVAYSCGIGNTAGLLAALFILKKKAIRLTRPENIRSFFRYMWDILKIGLPSSISSTAFTFSQTVTTAFVALIGDYALSAKVYYTSILSYVYLFSSSAGSANALMVGRCYGAGDFEKAEKMNRQLVKITTVVNLLVSLGVVFARKPLVGIFTNSELIIGLALRIFVVDIITEQARAVSQVYEYALRATGDVLCPVIVLTISCWVCSIGLAYFLAMRCRMGLIGCWIGLAADESFRAIFTYLRWKKGGWKQASKG